MMMLESEMKAEDMLPILNAIPGSHLILLPNAPQFTIVAVTDNYLLDTYLKREEILGRGVFEALTDNPYITEATGVKNLSASLHYVVQNKNEHRMPNQRYDIQNPQTGYWEHRIWQPLNKPVLDKEGSVLYIIHWVEDVTEKTELKRRANNGAKSLLKVKIAFD